MERVYSTQTAEPVTYFTGIEVEKTPVYGTKTLFVVGLPSVEEIGTMLGDCKHVYFGANHSCDPHSADEWQEWESAIAQCISAYTVHCTLDIAHSQAHNLTHSALQHNPLFIPMIRIAFPNAAKWSANTVLKIDDTTFDYSNPGVWCHQLRALQTHSAFTPWSEYADDEIIS
jgi:hypothetical protein